MAAPNGTDMKMSDIELMMDSMDSQKLIGINYNAYAYDCATPNLRDEFLNILKDEQQIAAELLNEMQKRGWYTVQPADPQLIAQTKQRFQSALG